MHVMHMNGERDFMRDFVRAPNEATAHDLWLRAQVQMGLDSANMGQLVPAATVEAKFAEKRAATRNRLVGSTQK